MDFPRYASFAAVKIVLWWEDEYYAAYKKNSGLLNLDEISDDDDGDRQNQPQKVIVKSSDPEKFVGSITKSADRLLGRIRKCTLYKYKIFNIIEVSFYIKIKDHIHILSQEALDHADLTVLTATIGASALIKNCLWVYLNSVTINICPPKGDESGGSLKVQQFNKFLNMFII